MLTREKIEHTFTNLLQRNVRIICGNKSIKTGKLLLVSQKNACICLLMLNQKNEPKNYEIPYPFEFNYNAPTVTVNLDYTIYTLCHGREDTIDNITKHIPEKTNRFFNKHVRIIGVE